jgi:glutamate racemase
MPRLLFLDSGLGGLTVLRAVRASVPEADVVYIADDAGFPYGALGENELRARLMTLMGEAIMTHAPDCVVLACNTASTIALTALRDAYSVPFVGTVPAIKPAAMLTRSGLVSILATPGTVARDYTRALIAEHGRGAHFTLVGTPRLAQLAEADARGEHPDDAAVLTEISPCFVRQADARTDVIVLGCTHYPLLAAALERLAPWPVTWLDPAPAIARRTANLLAEMGHVVGVGARPRTGFIAFTSGKQPAPSLARLLAAHDLAAAPSPVTVAAQ